jgi:predicted metal-dependent phosphoesterase TrpH
VAQINRYDLHIHSDFSSDSLNKPEKIVEIAKKAGLNGVAITDHHTIRGALVAKRLNRDKNFEVIVGEEINTDHGDIIALYIKKVIKGRNLWDVLDSIKSQKGIAIIPHPFRLWPRFKCPLEKLEGKVHGIETFNSRYGSSNRKASRIVNSLPFACIGSSDAHAPFDIGKAYTVFDGDLRTAIKRRRTVAKGTTRYGLISQAISTINQILVPLGLKKSQKGVEASKTALF